MHPIILAKNLLLAALVLLLVGSAKGQNTINVTVACSAHGNINPNGSFSLPVMSDMDVTATPDLGYEIEDWYLNGGIMGWSVQKQHLAFGDSDVNVYVNFRRTTNEVHAMAGSSGTLSPSGYAPILVGWGDSVTFTATPDANYRVDSWFVDSQPVQTGGNSFILADVKTNYSVWVTFTLVSYTVQASAGLHGNVSPSGLVEVAYDNSISFTATPDTSYEVAVWWLDGSPVQTNGTSFRLGHVSANRTLSVTFVAPMLQIGRTATNSVIVSWPATLRDWQFQENLLPSETGWTDVSLPQEEQNDRRQVVIWPPITTRFYRLLHP